MKLLLAFSMLLTPIRMVSKSVIVGVMDWEEFLLTMKLMTNNKMEQRVGLFFKAAEATYGSTLDFDATKKLC